VNEVGGSAGQLQPAALGRRAVLLGGAACALAAVGARSGTEPVSTEGGATVTRAERFAVQPDGVYAVRTTKPLVGLTFDDGPDPDFTPKVLDILDSFGVTATFFVVGANAAAAPELVQQAERAGHEIANHTQHHPELQRLRGAAVTAEIRDGQRSIVAQGVGAPALFRPPKGYTTATVAKAARRNGLRTVFWTQCVEHYLHVAGRTATARLIAADVKPGSIILAHDGGTIVGTHQQRYNRSASVAALPALIRGLQARGLQPVAMSSLLGQLREKHGKPQ
jgi:chitooligosaccharide deacetylase